MDEDPVGVCVRHIGIRRNLHKIIREGGTMYHEDIGENGQRQSKE